MQRLEVYNFINSLISQRRNNHAPNDGDHPSRTFFGAERNVHVLCAHDEACAVLSDPSFIQPDIAGAISVVSSTFGSDISALRDFVRHNPISVDGEAHRARRRTFLEHYGTTLSRLSGSFTDIARRCFENFCQSETPRKLEQLTTDYVDSIVEKIVADWGSPSLNRDAWAGSASCIFEYVHSPARLRKKAGQVMRIVSQLPASSEKEILLTYILQGRDPLIGALARILNNVGHMPSSDRATYVEKMNARELSFLTSPVNYIGRTATQSGSLNGTTVSAGDHMIIMLPWANANTVPKSSVAFGWGPHVCAGQALALSILTAWIAALRAWHRRIGWEMVEAGSFRTAVFVQYGK